MTLGPQEAVYRSSSGGVELRLRVTPGGSWVVIKGPGTESRYFDIPGDQVGAVVAEFQAIGEDPDKFAAFVNVQAPSLRQAPSEALTRGMRPCP